jgi:predicted small secreted protein
MKKLIALGIAGLAACSTISGAGRDVPPPSGGESVFVLGVAPENYAVTLSPGKVENGVFKAGAPLAARSPRDGYIVARVASGQALALTRTTRLAQGGAPASAPFGACDGARTMVFTAPGGKVVYLADIGYASLPGGGLDVRFDRNLDKAHQYLAANYPELAKVVAQGEYTFTPTNASCKK